MRQASQPAIAEVIDLCSESASDVDALHAAGEVSSPDSRAPVSHASDRGAADGTVTSTLMGPPLGPQSEERQANLALGAQPPGSSAAAGAGKASATSGPEGAGDSPDSSAANSSSIISIGRAYMPEPAGGSDASQGPGHNLLDHARLHDETADDTAASRGRSGTAPELSQELSEGLQRQPNPSSGLPAAITLAATSTRAGAADDHDPAGAQSQVLRSRMLVTQPEPASQLRLLRQRAASYCATSVAPQSQCTAHVRMMYHTADTRRVPSAGEGEVLSNEVLDDEVRCGSGRPVDPRDDNSQADDEPQVRQSHVHLIAQL